VTIGFAIDALGNWLYLFADSAFFLRLFVTADADWPFGPVLIDYLFFTANTAGLLGRIITFATKSPVSFTLVDATLFTALSTNTQWRFITVPFTRTLFSQSYPPCSF
jgi:hypothetical protein